MDNEILSILFLHIIRFVYKLPILTFLSQSAQTGNNKTANRAIIIFLFINIVFNLFLQYIGADIRHRSLGSPQTTTDMGSLRP